MATKKKVEKASNGKPPRSSARGSLRMKLAYLWVQQNRPDVFEACSAEAERVFPSKRTGPTSKVKLPASLANLT